MIPRALLARNLCLISTHTIPFRTLSFTTRSRPFDPRPTRSAFQTTPILARGLSSKSTADEKIEEITELYATAQDEFEIAMEETEKASVYAEEDRKAARAELTKVQEAYGMVMDGGDGHLAEEVRRRIGQRVRELEQGVAAMEEMALHQD